MTGARLMPRLASLVLSAGLFAIALTAPASGQGLGGAIPPVNSSVDGNGVDLMSGQFFTSSPGVSIGGPAGGIGYSQLIYGEDWRHSVMGTIDVSGSTYYVSIGGSTETFTKSGSTFTSDQQSGATLTQDGVTHDYTYTMRDGTVAIFDPDYVDYAQRYANEAVVISITAPTGELTSYYYGNALIWDWSNPSEPVILGAAYRLQSVTNNFGYQLHLRYHTATAGTPAALTNWYRLVEVTALNNTVERCHPTTNSCTLSNSWPTLEISNIGGAHTYTDALGFDTVINYSSNRINSINYPGGASPDISLSYSGSRVAFVTDGASNTWDYAYTPGSTTFITEVEDPTGQTITFTSNYDSLTGDLEETIHTDQSGQNWTTDYDSYGRPTRAEAPEGNYVTYTYDSRSNLTATVVYPASPGTGSIQSTATYPGSCSNVNTCNLPTATTNDEGYRTNYTYNSDGQLTKVEYPAPSGTTPVGSGARPTIEYFYDDQAAYVYLPHTGSADHLSAISMPHYSRTCSNNVLSSCTNANLSVSEVLYQISRDASPQAFSNILPVTIASCQGGGASGTTGSDYPQSIQCSSGMSGLRTASTTTWTRFGLPQTVDGPLSGSGDTSQYYYDSLGQRIEGMAGPDPDASDASIDHRAVRFGYDGSTGFRNRIERGHVDSHSSGDWASFTVHDRIEIDFDNAGRPEERRAISVTSGTPTIESVVQMSYTARSQVECVALRMNPAQYSSLPGACTRDTPHSEYGDDRITRYTYRSTGQVQSVTTGYNTSPDASISVNYVYWDDGLLARVDDGEGRQTTYTYDYFRRLQGIFHADPATGLTATSPSDVMVFGYDSAGRMNAILNRDGTGLTYGYDNLGRVASVNRSATNQDFEISYDLLGRTTQQRILNYSGFGQYFEAGYDALGRVTSAGYSDGGSNDYFARYQYDAAGRRTQMDWDGTANYITYEYDTTGALTSIRENGSSELVGYSYDNYGRLTLEARMNDVDTSYGYDAASRLTSMTHNLNGSSNDVTLNFTWNPAGQMVSRRMSNLAYGYDGRTAGTTNYDINGLNQIDEIVGGASFTYDDDGNLTGIGSDTHTYDDLNRLTEADGGTDLSYGADGQLDSLNGTARRFSYDGANVTAERNSAGAMAYRYVHAGGLGAPLMRYSGTGTSTREFYLTDERGSVIAATNNSGNAAYINAYDEYGIEETGNSGTFGYAGMMRLAGEGMTHNRNRAYNPGLGRFMQADPIGQSGGLNLYAYVGGDPVNFSDPLGLSEKKTQPACGSYEDKGRDERGRHHFIRYICIGSGLGGGGATLLGGLFRGFENSGGGGGAAGGSAEQTACPLGDIEENGTSLFSGVVRRNFAVTEHVEGTEGFVAVAIVTAGNPVDISIPTSRTELALVVASSIANELVPGGLFTGSTTVTFQSGQPYGLAGGGSRYPVDITEDVTRTTRRATTVNVYEPAGNNQGFTFRLSHAQGTAGWVRVIGFRRESGC